MNTIDKESATPAANAVENLNLSTAVKEALPPPPAVPPAGKARVSVGFLVRDSDAALIGASLSILNGMTGNAVYPAPLPKLADLAAARNSYIAAVEAAKDSRRGIVVRRQQRAAFAAMLRNLALYVQVASGGDLATLLSSGFTARRSRQPVGLLTAPGNLRLFRGKTSGQLIARCAKLRQAGSYEWRYASAATPTAWVPLATLAARVIIDGLVPGAQYLVQARARGTAGASDWSDAAMLMVV